MDNQTNVDATKVPNNKATMNTYQERDVMTQKLETKFNIRFPDLAGLMYKTDAFIAGSFPLNLFLEKELYDGMDMDIYIRIPYKKRVDSSSNPVYSYEQLMLDTYAKFLFKRGYKVQEVMTGSYLYGFSVKEYGRRVEKSINPYIKSVKAYEHKETGAVVQLIVLYSCLTQDVLREFDLNIVRIALFPRDKRTLEITYNPEDVTDIIQRKMYVRKLTDYNKVKERVEKYVSRGFTLCDPHGIFSKEDAL